MRTYLAYRCFNSATLTPNLRSTTGDFTQSTLSVSLARRSIKYRNRLFLLISFSLLFSFSFQISIFLLSFSLSSGRWFNSTGVDGTSSPSPAWSGHGDRQRPIASASTTRSPAIFNKNNKTVSPPLFTPLFCVVFLSCGVSTPSGGRFCNCHSLAAI